MYTIDNLLSAVVQYGGSDLHCKSGSSPRVRVDGELKTLQTPAVTPDEVGAYVEHMLGEDAYREFLQTNEADFAYEVSGVGRFRVNAFRTKGAPAVVARVVAETPKTIDELNLPEVVRSLASEPRGLVLVTGPTGSGKTTSLAAMIDHINSTKAANIITIEDPIEIMHEDKKSLVAQREVHHDTADFSTALRGAMRQDPDVILIGEMRDTETVRAALSAAETGHLVLSTLHTIDAQETINRIIEFFPPHEQTQIRHAVAQALRGILSQRLVPSLTGGRVAAIEILINNGRIADAIEDPMDSDPLFKLIEDGSQYYGMQTFDQHLLKLAVDGLVAPEVAIDVATVPTDLQIELRRAGFNL